MDSNPGELNKPFSIWILGPPDSKASNGDNIASASIADNQKKCANLPLKKKQVLLLMDSKNLAVAKLDNVRGLIHPPKILPKGKIFEFVQNFPPIDMQQIPPN